MMTKIQESKVTLPSTLDFASTHDLGKLIADAIGDADRLILDAGSVERIGTPAIQILVAADQQMKADNRRLALQPIPEVVRTAFGDLGLSAVISEWEAN